MTTENDLHVVRCYERNENRWFDVSRPVTMEEAQRIWNESTRNGTAYTTYAHGSYFEIFPAETRMLFA